VIRWKLNEVMAKKRIRNKDLAEALDITENSVYRLRKTDEMPRLTPERLNGICEVLNCQPGDLLEWVADTSNLLEWVADSRESLEPIRATGTTDAQIVPRRVLNNVSRFCDEILSLFWQGHNLYGPGAVIYTEKPTGPEIAYVEREKLSDPNCHSAIDHNHPETSAVVLYYPSESYDTNNYIIFTLTGPKSPPDSYTLRSQQ
jgi:putative transcriptional regulator